MTILRETRALGTFREPQFVDLAHEHVPFDDLTGGSNVERALQDALAAGGSAAVGPRGGRKSSVLAWVCEHACASSRSILRPVTPQNRPQRSFTYA